VIEHRYLPEANRVSVLTAVVLLAYALTRLIEVPHFPFIAHIASFEFSFDINLNAAIAFLAAGLTATGMDWLLRSHPAFKRNAIEHWLLPALTAWSISVPLYTLPSGTYWWLAFGLGGLLLVLVFLAEYVVVDPADARYATATTLLTALSFALFLVLAISMRYTGVRLFLQLPALSIAAGLVALRTLHLRLGGRWEYPWAGGIALMTAQLAAAWHYWPLAPVQFGLALFAPVYAATTLAVDLGEEGPLKRALVESSVALVVIWGLAFGIR
jgi:hypothetical protein